MHHTLVLRPFVFFVSLILLFALPLQAQNHTYYLPALQSSDGGSIRVVLVNTSSSEANVVLTARDYNGNIIQDVGVQNPVTRAVPPEGQLDSVPAGIFGDGVSGKNGWVQID